MSCEQSTTAAIALENCDSTPCNNTDRFRSRAQPFRPCDLDPLGQAQASNLSPRLHQNHPHREDELRRAFSRARTMENKPPAEPTRARTTVEFSGESVQPVCAWSGTAAHRINPTQKKSLDHLFTIAPLAKALPRTAPSPENRWSDHYSQKSPARSSLH